MSATARGAPQTSRTATVARQREIMAHSLRGFLIGRIRLFSLLPRHYFDNLYTRPGRDGYPCRRRTALGSRLAARRLPDRWLLLDSCWDIPQDLCVRLS